MRMRQGTLVVFLTLAALAACEQTPVGPEEGLRPAAAELARAGAEVLSHRIVEPVWGHDLVPCALDGAGEWVEYEGEIERVSHVTMTPEGTGHGWIRIRPLRIVGVGETSGELYRFLGGSHETYDFTVNGADFSLRINDTFRIIGKGPGNNLHIRYRALFVMEDGRLVQDQSDLDIRCQ